VATPEETWSLAVFQRAACQAIAGIHSREKLPFLVGGTGQYVRAVTEGWAPPEQQPHPELRAALERWAGQIGAAELHRRLALIDPPAAANIDPPNVRRTVRALEVIFLTGRRFSDQRRKVQSPYSRLTIGLTRPREELYRRIDARIEAMLAAGWLEEVRGLLAQGYSPELPSLSAIGYRELVAYLHGQWSLDEAVAHIQRLTRQFVRRQANWFKAGDPSIHWFPVDEYTLEHVEALILSGQGWIEPGEAGQPCE
ncbi:MAG: tRNA (adenosine(37)-N6)-dimethylallyltransferase MiaA, partial [Chloroflexi bacterium]|nr:tRNA (adenosine(37)-N6)-dimethylallyltransferase MiaA [Chloroflexota bacterium]